jgi:hypothetical protein
MGEPGASLRWSGAGCSGTASMTTHRNLWSSCLPSGIARLACGSRPNLTLQQQRYSNLVQVKT